MNERHPEELLAPFVDGELEADERRAVEAHVAACSVCAEEVGLARRAATLTRDLPEVPAPLGLATPAIQRARPESRWARRLGVATAGAAAAAILAIFAVSVFTRGDLAPSGADLVDSDGAPAAEGPEVSALSAGSLFIETRNDYSAEDLAERVQMGTLSGRGDAESDDVAVDSDASLDSPAGKAAVRCVESAGLTGEDGATLLQIELARFEGSPAYIVTFRRTDDALELWVIDRSSCSIRYVAEG